MNTSELFNKANAISKNPCNQERAIKAYKKVLEEDPTFAAAHINLSVIYCEKRNFVLAEKHQRLAIASDPKYPIAYFNLGNTLDELGRTGESIHAYKTALQLSPTYADAHYNLALSYEKIREFRKALKHWQAYAKLDESGLQWVSYAKDRVKRILQVDILKVVVYNPNPTTTTNRANLFVATRSLR